MASTRYMILYPNEQRHEPTHSSATHDYRLFGFTGVNEIMIFLSAVSSVVVLELLGSS